METGIGPILQNGPKKRGKDNTCVAGPPRTMSCIAWNCRGLGQPRTVRFFKEICQQLKPGFIFLSETLTNKNKIEAICKSIGFAGCWVVDAYGHSGGLALI